MTRAIFFPGPTQGEERQMVETRNSLEGSTNTVRPK